MGSSLASGKRNAHVEKKKKTCSTRLKINRETKQPQSSKNDIKLNWTPTCYTRISFHPLHTVAFSSALFSSPSASSSFLDIEPTARSNQEFLICGIIRLRLITPDCVDGCVTVFGLRGKLDFDLTDWEVCVPLQSKHSLSCFALCRLL